MPGITSAIAVPAYAGIPVTLAPLVDVVHRRHRPRGPGRRRRRHASTGGRSAQVGGTIVILMGVARIARIAEELIAGGLDARHAGGGRALGHPTRAGDRAGDARAPSPTQPLATPSVIVVGEVAAVDLAWFERRPLFGRRVVVTRTRQQASALSPSARATPGPSRSRCR